MSKSTETDSQWCTCLNKTATRSSAVAVREDHTAYNV